MAGKRRYGKISDAGSVKYILIAERFSEMRAAPVILNKSVT